MKVGDEVIVKQTGLKQIVHAIVGDTVELKKNGSVKALYHVTDIEPIEQYEKGELVEVSEDGIDWCNPKEFLCEYENKYWCKDNSEAAFSWNYIRKIKPKEEFVFSPIVTHDDIKNLQDQINKLKEGCKVEIGRGS